MNDIAVYIAIGIVLVIAYFGARLYRDHKTGVTPEPFDEQDFVEVERPALRPDAPLAPVFRINDDPTDRLEAWANQAVQPPTLSGPKGPRLENYYMTVAAGYTESGRHPFIPEMKPTQWVRIVAQSQEEARAIANHYSGGYYATLLFQDDFLNTKDFYPHGEYEVLSTENYWKFLDSEVI